MKKIKSGNNLELHLLHETRTISFHAAVDRHSIESTLNALTYLSGINKNPIIIRFCSPGGSVDHGLVLYDAIKASKVPIHTVCTGMAASMAAILLGAGKKGKRHATKNSRIMIHQPSSGVMGKASDIEIHAKELYRIRALLNKLISQDTGRPFNKVVKDTELDLWMTAEEALKYGIIDKII